MEECRQSKEYLDKMVEVSTILYRKGRADMLTLLERKRFTKKAIKKYHTEAESTYQDLEIFRSKYPQLQS